MHIFVMGSIHIYACIYISISTYLHIETRLENLLWFQPLGLEPWVKTTRRLLRRVSRTPRPAGRYLHVKGVGKARMLR